MGVTERALGGLAPLLLALALSGCTGAGEPGAAPQEAYASEEAGAEAVTTAARLGTVTGRLEPERRERVVARVTSLVDDWMDAAFVEGDYPRAEFAGAFTSFTRGARQAAVRDAALMTNADLGERIDGVEVVSRRVIVDVLAARGRPAAITARFGLAFDTSGEVSRRVDVRGRLLLRPGEDGWTVFGYRVSKGER